MIVSALVLALSVPQVRTGHHEVAGTPSDVIVDTTWVLESMAQSGAHIELAAPLPRNTTIEGARPSFGADGRIVAVRLEDSCSRCTLRTSTSWSDVEKAGALPVLVAEEPAVHRIAFDPSVSFRPDAELELVTELGFTAPAGFGLVERMRVDAELAVDAPALGVYYVRAEDVAQAGGLVGELVRREDAQRRTAWVAAGVFVLLCGVAAFEYRRARKRAELERAEAILEAEFAGLEDTKP